MAGPVRLFVNVQRFFHISGIVPPQINSKWRLNWKNYLILYSLMQMFIATMAFCIFEAKTLFDYSSCAFICSTELACFIAYLLQSFGIVNILNWIQSFDELIETSK